MRFVVPACVLVWLCACMNAPHGGAEAFDAGGDGAIDRGVDAGPIRPPFGHLPAGPSCGDGPGAAGDPALGGAAFASDDDAGGGSLSLQPSAAGGDDAGRRVPAPSRAGELVITELMADPKTLDDSTGEWFELHNRSAGTFDLEGCAIADRGATPSLIKEHVLVPAGAYLSVARNLAVGFEPGLVASFSLTNTAGQLALVCGGVDIDRLVFDKSQGFPLMSGASAALDDAGVWCLGSASYGPGLGTPGAANPACASSSASAP